MKTTIEFRMSEKKKKKKKMKTTIEFRMFELVQVPSFCLNW